MITPIVYIVGKIGMDGLNAYDYSTLFSGGKSLTIYDRRNVASK